MSVDYPYLKGIGRLRRQVGKREGSEDTSRSGQGTASPGTPAEELPHGKTSCARMLNMFAQLLLDRKYIFCSVEIVDEININT